MRCRLPLLLVALVAAQASGQTLPTPRITLVTPPGGRAGATFEVAVTGLDLNEAEGLYFNFPGAKVEVSTSALVKADPKLKQPGMKTGTLTAQKFKVTLPTNAPTGIHDVRIVTKGGVSNPRAFVVGDLKEYVEQEPNDDVAKPHAIELDSTVSGVIANPTDVDYFQFSGKKGQRVVVSCLSTSIDSKLPAQVQIFLRGIGQELAANRNYHNNDALADCVLPGDGDYYVRVSSFAYILGGPDYFYRLTVSTAPWIDAVFPSTVAPGQETKVTVLGRNLPGGAIDPNMLVDGRPLEKVLVTIKAPDQIRDQQRLRFAGFVSPAASVLDGFALKLKNDSGTSNPALITVARAPVVLDAGGNDTPERAQKIPVPCEISGRIEAKNDRDWFQFTAKKGEVLTIEAFGERLGAPLDLYFVVQNAKGQTLTEQDDNAETMAPQFFARSDDPPRYRFIAPADGEYQLMIGARDAFTQFGPRHHYVVRIVPEQPDFRLVAMPVHPQFPDSVVLGQGGNQAYNLYVWRLGGFAGEITLSGEKLPPGLSVKPQVLQGNQKQGVLVVSAGKEAAPWVGGVTILGTAVIGGEKVVREVRGATITWPVPAPNLPTISRLDRELVLAIRDKAPYTLSVDKEQITVLQGEKITIPVKLTPSEKFKGNVQVAALQLPPGMVSAPLTLTAGKETGNITIDYKGTATAGQFTLVLRGQTQPINPKQPVPQPKSGGPVNLVQLTAPIQLTVIPKSVAKLSLPQTAVKVPVGKKVELAVKVARLFDYTGPFKIEATLPEGAKGLTIEAPTIKAGEDEAKIVIRADPDAKIGANVTIGIRVTAMFSGRAIVHEGKATVTITK